MIRPPNQDEQRQYDRSQPAPGGLGNEIDSRLGRDRLSMSPLPPRVPSQPIRRTQQRIPQDREVRDRLRLSASRQVSQAKLAAPLSIDELRSQASKLCRECDVDIIHADYAAILINNETWMKTVAGTPFDKRLLLLPRCMRKVSECTAKIDDFGLACARCGSCSIDRLQKEAEDLGYAVLVAEGTTLVSQMIETGQIEAIIGVSCMDVLEKCFTQMEARAVPGIAIPLLQDGCADTTVDLDWVQDAIHLSSEDRSYNLNLHELRKQVEGWFSPDGLRNTLGPPADQTEEIAFDWLMRGGKRWRPFLTACAYLSITGQTADDIDNHDNLKKLAIAVECFHKASLAHDDIEDDDSTRYGEPALHTDHGMPVALNVGDFLLGMGYQLIGELDVDDATGLTMSRTASAGHLMLSRGQGAELCWMQTPKPLTSVEVLNIFRCKTAPAFEVALKLGANLAQADTKTLEVLSAYSEALGIAYQIRDDLEDISGSGDSDDLQDGRPSLILAIAHKRAKTEEQQNLTTALWKRARVHENTREHLLDLMKQGEVIETTEGLLQAYVAQAASTLGPLDNATLKGLLRRVIGKIFPDGPLKGYCSEFEAQHARYGEAGK